MVLTAANAAHPGAVPLGVALDLDESYAHEPECLLHLRRRGPPPGTTSYSRHADEQRSKEAIKKAQAADQAGARQWKA